MTARRDHTSDAVEAGASRHGPRWHVACQGARQHQLLHLHHVFRGVRGDRAHGAFAAGAAGAGSREGHVRLTGAFSDKTARLIETLPFQTTFSFL